MSTSTILTAIIWGALTGALGLQLLANLLALLFCLHGLLQTRWKRLSKKMTGQVKYSTILPLMLKIALYALLFGALLHFGDDYVRRVFWFEYRQNQALLYTATATVIAIGLLPAAWRRLRIIWRMSHEFDYAERRQRTRMLKS
jgi:hypothetical protein